MIEIRPITAEQILGLPQELMRMHQHETEDEFDNEKVVPNASYYRALEAMGGCVAFGAFDDDVIVGYVVMIVIQHQHYDFKYGHHDTLFVRPDVRGSLGIRLMQRAREAAKALGARHIVWHAKPGSMMEKLLIKKQCVIEDVLYKEEC